MTGPVKGIARDPGSRDITVNNLNPGPIDTDMHPVNTGFAVPLHSVITVPRHGHADEVADPF